MAAHILNPDELLKTVCGSMPFCAPEVLVRQLARKGGSEEQHRGLQVAQSSNGGYDSLAADIWSLGLNVFELLIGPSSTERVLGWRQEPPKADQKSIEKLLTLPELCAKALSESSSPLSYIIHAIQNQIKRVNSGILQCAHGAFFTEIINHVADRISYKVTHLPCNPCLGTGFFLGWGFKIAKTLDSCFQACGFGLLFDRVWSVDGINR